MTRSNRRSLRRIDPPLDLDKMQLLALLKGFDYFGCFPTEEALLACWKVYRDRLLLLWFADHGRDDLPYAERLLRKEATET